MNPQPLESFYPNSSKHSLATLVALTLALSTAVVVGDETGELGTLCRDRTAIERIYHQHRINNTRLFEDAVPADAIARKVAVEQLKEKVLREHYGVGVTAEMVDAEVRRIEKTTRAPDMLTLIKQALGNDPQRFARSVARPIVVERELRQRFENDAKLHARQRLEAEQARDSLKAGGTIAGMHEITWQLSEPPRPAPATTPPAQTSATIGSSHYSVEATAQITQPLSTTSDEDTHKAYFQDLHPQFQRVLKAQLRQPGDVSAVIETATGFVVFIAREITSDHLTVASVSIPKQNYQQWLATKQPSL